MDFVLSEEQQSIFDMAHDFAEQMIAPHAVNWDQTEQMPKDVLRQSAERSNDTRRQLCSIEAGITQTSICRSSIE